RKEAEEPAPADVESQVDQQAERKGEDRQGQGIERNDANGRRHQANNRKDVPGERLEEQEPNRNLTKTNIPSADAGHPARKHAETSSATPFGLITQVVDRIGCGRKTTKATAGLARSHGNRV